MTNFSCFRSYRQRLSVECGDPRASFRTLKVSFILPLCIEPGRKKAEVKKDGKRYEAGRKKKTELDAVDLPSDEVEEERRKETRRGADRVTMMQQTSAGGGAG